MVAIVGVIEWVLWAMENKEKWLYSIAPISWLICTTVLWTVFFFHYDADILRVWGSVVMLQGIILVTASALVVLIQEKSIKIEAKRLAKLWEEKEL
jgi:hypothetical protein